MKILLNRSDAIGDTVLTLPMTELIKEKYPQAQLIFLASEKVRGLFEHHPLINDVWYINRKQSFFQQFSFLWKQKWDFTHYIHVGGSHLPTFVSFLKRVKNRLGLKAKWQEFIFLNQGQRQKRSQVKKHEALYNLDLLQNLDITYSQKPELKLYLQSGEVEKTWQEFIQEVNPQGELIILHPGMMGHTLNWPIDFYAKWIQKIEQQFPQRFFFLISYTLSDLNQVQNLKKELGSFTGKVYFWDGTQKGLRNYIHILSKAKLFLGGSTGPTHLANALGIPVITFYSPIRVQRAERWGPYNQNQSVVLFPLAEGVDCMRTIPVEKALQKAQDFLK